jgi:hypothetical protein
VQGPLPGSGMYEQPYSDFTYHVQKDIIGLACKFLESPDSLNSIDTFNRMFKLRSDSSKNPKKEIDALFFVKDIFDLLSKGEFKVNLSSFLSLKDNCPALSNASEEDIERIFTVRSENSDALLFETFRHAILDLLDLCQVPTEATPELLRNLKVSLGTSDA